MKQVKTMPTEGQFVAVWEDKGKTYCVDCEWSDYNIGKLFKYDCPGEVSPKVLMQNNPIYYIAG